MLSVDGKYFFFARNGPSVPFAFQGNSFSEMIGRLRTPKSGYGCLYWVDAEFVYELHPRLGRWFFHVHRMPYDAKMTFGSPFS